MSSIAAWSYMYTATVTPVGGVDGVTGETLDGTPYTIACNVVATQNTDIRPSGGAASGIDGDEWIGRHTIYTEDPRPRKGDMIEFDGSDGQQIIRDRTMWDMTMFDDVPDYKLET